MKVFDSENPEKNWRIFLFLNALLSSLVFLLFIVLVILFYKLIFLFDTVLINKILNAYLGSYFNTIIVVLILPIILIILGYTFFLLKKRRNKKWRRKRFLPYTCRYCMFSDFNCAFEKGVFSKEKSIVYSNKYISSEVNAYLPIRLKKRLKIKAKRVLKSSYILLFISIIYLVFFLISSYLIAVSSFLLFHILVILTLLFLGVKIKDYFLPRKKLHNELASFASELVNWKVKCAGLLLRSKDVLWYFTHYWIAEIPKNIDFKGYGISVIVDDYPIMLYVQKKSIYFSYNIFVSAIIPSFSFFSHDFLPEKLNKNTRNAIGRKRLMLNDNETTINVDFSNSGIILSAHEHNLTSKEIYDIILSVLDILSDMNAKQLTR